MSVKVELEEVKNDFPDFGQLIRALPGLSARVLGMVGHEGVQELQKMMEAGEQGIQFRKMRSDRTSMRSGRRMISYAVGRGGSSVKISSSTLNLFERGRLLRSGEREKARPILRGTLKQRMNSNMSSIMDRAVTKILGEWLEKEGKQ